MEETKIPADKSAYGSFHILYDENQIRLREIIEDAANQENKTPGSDVQKVGDFYASFMDSAKIEELGLQPFYSHLSLDDAVNYGGISAVIGHEITHGFDDQGRKYDGNGNMREWWTEEDAKRFDVRAQVVIDQYNEFIPIESLHINGELTLGKNIADIGGLTVLFNAYQLSLKGEEPPILNGFTGNQRVFIGWAQSWRLKAHDEYIRNQVLTDPHSYPKYRVIGVMNNLPEFYAAFDVKEGDGHYLPEDKRVKIW